MLIWVKTNKDPIKMCIKPPTKEAVMKISPVYSKIFIA